MSATPVYSTELRKTFFKCPDLQDHLLRAVIALKYLKETHYFSKNKVPSLVTKIDHNNYVEPSGFVMEANSLDFTDADLTLSHYGAVSRFIGDVHNTGPSAPQSQPESDSGEIGPGASVPDDSNRINESSGHDADDPSIVLETPSYTISINQEVHHVEPSVPVDESQESIPTRPFTPTLASIPEEESEESTPSLPQDSSCTIAQQETHTMEATLEASESTEVINDTSEVTIDESESTEDINQEPESSEAINEASDSTEDTKVDPESSQVHFESVDAESSELTVSVQPEAVFSGSQDPGSTEQLDSEQAESDDSTSTVLPESTSKAVYELSISVDSVFKVSTDNTETASEDPDQPSEVKSLDANAFDELQVSVPSGSNGLCISTVQAGTSVSLPDEPTTSVIPDSSDQFESAETSAHAVNMLTEAASYTVLTETVTKELSDSTSLPQEEGDTLQVESEVTSIEDTAEPTTPQDTSLVQPDSSLNEVAIANATDASNDQSGSQDLTPPVTVPHTGEVQDDHDSSEDGTPQSHSAPSTEADATPSTEPRSSEHPTTIEQQEQSDNVSIDQGVYDVTAGLHSFGNDISVVQFSEDSEDHVQKFITFSDGVTATYSFFIMHNTPLCTPPDPLKDHKFSEHVEGPSAERDDLFSESYISDVHWEDITLPDDDQSDDENELDVYLTDDLTTLGEPSSGFQVQPSTTPDTVEHTIPTETTSIPPEVESTIQLESTSVDVRAEHTSPDSTESTPTEFYSILTDKQGPTQHTVLSEESSEDSENSLEQESSSDSQGMTEVSQNSSDELEGSALKTNLRATDSHVTDSLKPSDNSHTNVEELSENQAENLEVKSEFPSSSLEQHTTPVSDCNIWF